MLHMEVPLRCQLNTLSWKDAKLSKLPPDCYKPLNCSKFPNLGLFWFMGLGRFSECGLVNCLFWLRKWINIQINIKSPYLSPSSLLTTSSSVCASRVYQIERAVYSSLVCLCHGSVYCATSMPDELEVWQHASRCLQMSWRSWRWATVPDGSSSFTKTVLMVWFICLWWYLLVLLSHVMAYWLCLSPFIVLKSIL